MIDETEKKHPVLMTQDKPWPTFESTPDIIRPLPGHVVLVRDDPVPTKAGGILLPAGARDPRGGSEQAQQRGVMATGFVVACGPPAMTDSGVEIKCPVKPGDHVLTSRASLATHKGKDRNGADVIYEILQFGLLGAVIEDPVEEPRTALGSLE